MIVLFAVRDTQPFSLQRARDTNYAVIVDPSAYALLNFITENKI